jgi:hypothetical protein
MVDVEMGDENTTEVFKDKWETLCNSVSYDKHDMSKFL